MWSFIISMNLEIYLGDICCAFLGPKSKWLQSSCLSHWLISSIKSLKLWVYAQFFNTRKWSTRKSDLSTNLLFAVFLVLLAKLAATRMLCTDVCLFWIALKACMFWAAFWCLSDPKWSSTLWLGWSPNPPAFSMKGWNPEPGAKLRQILQNQPLWEGEL